MWYYLCFHLIKFVLQYFIKFSVVSFFCLTSWQQRTSSVCELSSVWLTVMVEFWEQLGILSLQLYRYLIFFIFCLSLLLLNFACIVTSCSVLFKTCRRKKRIFYLKADDSLATGRDSGYRILPRKAVFVPDMKTLENKCQRNQWVVATDIKEENQYLTEDSSVAKGNGNNQVVRYRKVHKSNPKHQKEEVHGLIKEFCFSTITVLYAQPSLQMEHM